MSNLGNQFELYRSTAVATTPNQPKQHQNKHSYLESTNFSAYCSSSTTRNEYTHPYKRNKICTHTHKTHTFYSLDVCFIGSAIYTPQHPFRHIYIHRYDSL